MSIRNRLGVVFGLLSVKLLEPTIRDAVKEQTDDWLATAGLGAKRAGERKIKFHDLRHSFGTLAVQVFPLSDYRPIWATQTSARPCATCITFHALDMPPS